MIKTWEFEYWSVREGLDADMEDLFVIQRAFIHEN